MSDAKGGKITESGHRINVSFPSQFEKTMMLTKTIQTINGSASLTPKEKANMIKKLPGITRQEMATLLNQLYGGGPRLSLFVAAFLSPKRLERVKAQNLLKKKNLSRRPRKLQEGK